MLMPEAAMDEDDFPPRPKREVRLSRQVLAMQAIAVPQPEGSATNRELRRGVSMPY